MLLLVTLLLFVASSAASVATDGLSTGASLSSAQPLGVRVKLVAYDYSPLTSVSLNFRGGLFDGTYVWLVPTEQTALLRIEPATGTNSAFSSWPYAGPVSNHFYGGVFDGTLIWLVPFDAPAVVSVVPSTGAMTSYTGWPASTGALSIGTGAFFAGSIASGTVYFQPWKSDRILTVNTVGGAMAGITSSHGSVSFASQQFRGMLFDGTFMWLIPATSQNVVSVHTGTHAMAIHSSWPAGFPGTLARKFHGGAFDGTFLWFVPLDASSVVRFDVNTHAMEAFSAFPADVPVGGGDSFNGGCYDGDALWLTPRGAAGVVRVSSDGTMRSYTDFPTGTAMGDRAFYGCVPDGGSVWLVNNKNPVLTRVMPVTATATQSLVRNSLVSSDGMSSGAALPGAQPLGKKVRLLNHGIAPLNVKSTNFRSGVFDGTYVWMVPAKQPSMLRIDPATGANSVFSGWPGGVSTSTGNKFYGGVFDGSTIWLIPFNTPALVAVVASTGVMTASTAWPATTAELAIGLNAFVAGTVAHGTVYVMPWHADRILTINTAGGAMGQILSSHANVNLTEGSGPFRGAAFDGSRVWMIPATRGNAHVVSLDPDTHAMSIYSGWPAAINPTNNRKFFGGAFDGTFLWFVPYSQSSVVRFDVNTGAMEAFSAFPADVPAGGNSFNGGCFDGEALWLTPRNAAGIVRVDGADGSMQSYTDFPSGAVLGSQAYHGCVADGESVWMVNAKSPLLVRITGSPTPSSTGTATQLATRSPSPSTTFTDQGLPTLTKPTSTTNSISNTQSPGVTPSLVRSLTRSIIPTGSESASTSLPPTRTRLRTPSASSLETSSLTASSTIPLTTTVTSVMTQTAPLTPSSTASLTTKVTQTATIAPPIPFNATLGFQGAVFAGAAHVAMSALLTLSFDSLNHLGAAVARHNVSIVCANATVDTGSAWTTPFSTPIGTADVTGVLQRPILVSLPAAFRGVSDACQLVVCAPYLGSCAMASGDLPIEYPELNVTATVIASAVRVHVAVVGSVPAENVTLTVDVQALVGVRLARVMQSNNKSTLLCTEDNPLWSCNLGRLHPAGSSNDALEFTLVVPAFYVGEVSVLAAARPSNTDAVFLSRLVYDVTTARVLAHEDGLVNVSGLTVFLDVVEKALNVSSLPLPPGGGLMMPSSPKGFFARTASGFESSPIGLHFVLLTTLVFACILAVGVLVAHIRRNAPVPMLAEMPTWRIVAAHHLWAGVILPCTVRCVSVHATTLYVGVLASYATVASVLAVTGSHGSGSRLVLAAVAGAASMSVPRAATWLLFHAYRVPNIVEVVSGRSTLKQICSRRAEKVRALRRRSKHYTVSGDVRDSFRECDLMFAVTPMDDSSLCVCALPPLDLLDDEATQSGWLVGWLNIGLSICS